MALEKVCQCSPKLLEKLGYHWIDAGSRKWAARSGWHRRTAYGMPAEAFYDMVERCSECRGSLLARPRPDAWLSSDEYMARQAVRELLMQKWRRERIGAF